MPGISTVIPAFPPAPDSASPDTFDDLADPFVDRLEQLPDQLNAWADEANALAVGNVYGLTYTFAGATAAADPGAGKLRLNNANPALATALYISETDRQGVGQAPTIAGWDDSGTSGRRGTLRIVKGGDANTFLEYIVSGVLTDAGAWDTLTVTYNNGNGAIADTDPVVLVWLPAGADGRSAEFVSPTRTITGNGTITAADNGYCIDTTAGGVTLTLDTPAGLGAGFSCLFLDSPNPVTLTGTFNDGAVSKVVAANTPSMLLSDGTKHRVVTLSAIRGIVASGGTVSAITATVPSAPAANIDGTRVQVRASGANTSQTPTFALNGAAAKTIVKGNSAPLVIGDIGGAAHVMDLLFDGVADKWVLLNPINPCAPGTVLQMQSFAADSGSSGSSSSFVNLTNTTKSITPRSNNSIIKVTCSFAGQVLASGAGTNAVAAFSIFNSTSGSYASASYVLGVSTASGANSQIDAPVSVHGRVVNAALATINFLLHGKYTLTGCTYGATAQMWTISEIQQ